MISIAAYSETRTFNVQPRELKLTRRYEEKEYAFVAGDISLTCVNAQPLYDALTQGEEVSFVVYRDQTCIFRGIFQAEGMSFDPEKMEYQFTVVHNAKRLFDHLKTLNRMDSSAIISYNTSNHEWRGNVLDVLTLFGEQLNLTDYNMRTYLIDLAKHVRGVVTVRNDLTNGLPVIDLLNRKILANTLHIGYDDLIADYTEEYNNAEYHSVIFPLRATIAGRDTYGFCLYSREHTLLWLWRYSDFYDSGIAYRFGDVECRFVNEGEPLPLTDALDMRVPSALFSNQFPSALPHTFVPIFTYTIDGIWLPESPKAYADRFFKMAVRPFKKIEVTYREALPINPLEQMAVQGANVQIVEIEDDLKNETTTIIGRKDV